MTSRGVGHPFAIAAWMLLAAVVIAASVGVLGGILSEALVVDAIAMWPILALGAVGGLGGRWLGRRRGRRARAVLPLALFTAVVLMAALHLGGWSQLPSAEARLTGPTVDEMSNPTEFIVQIPGRIELSSAAGDVAYQVDPILRGGEAGVPEATETSVDGASSVELGASQEAPSWYSFSGWRIDLSSELSWRLVLNGELAADLRTLPIASATVAGSGAVRLGPPPTGGASIIVAGDIDLIVPATAAVAASGDVSVPSSWETEGDTSRSPEALEAGDHWSVSIQGNGRPRIREG